MRKLAILFFALCSLSGTCLAQRTPPGTGVSGGSGSGDETKKAIAWSAYHKLPLSFEVNQGQTDPQVRFISRGRGYNLFLTPDGAVLRLSKRSSSSEGSRGQSSVIWMRLIGADLQPQITGLDQLPGSVNYLIGDKANWRTDLRTYGEVKYRDVYPGVDLVYHGNEEQLEYDFVISPGVDPRIIRLEFDGIDKLETNSKGDIQLLTTSGTLRLQKPSIFQEIDGVRHQVSGGYVLSGTKGQVAFQVADYDLARPLVIDPVLVYSTYLGGSDNESGTGIAVDSLGNAYVTGFTGSSNFPLTGYPSAPTAFQNALGGSGDAFVTKFDPTGNLVYSTYLGGSLDDSANGIAVDPSGNAYVTGLTYSLDFPVKNAYQSVFLPGGIFKSSNAGNSWNFLGLSTVSVNAVAINPQVRSTIYAGTSGGVFKSTDSGATWNATPLTDYINSNALVIDPVNLSTLYAGTLLNGTFKSTDGGASWNPFNTGLPQSSSFFDQIGALAIDPTNTAVIYAGVTSAGLFKSTDGGSTWNATSLPVAANVFSISIDPQTPQTIYAVTGQGLFKSTDGGTNWSLTGLNNSANAFAINPTSTSTLYAGTDSGVLESTDGGATWSVKGLIFVTCLIIDPATPTTLYGCSVGGISKSTDGGASWSTSSSGLTQPFVNTLAIDSTNPAVPAILYAGTVGSNSEAFVTELNSTGTDLVYSSYLGGSGGDQGNGIAIDAFQDVYVTGTTGSTNFPTTAGAFQTSYRGVFVAKLNPGASGANSLVYSTFLGGSFNGGDDRGMAIAADSSGNAYVTGRTHATDFPTTAGAYKSTCGTDANCNGGNEDDVFVTEINSTGSALVYSTYLGGSAFEQGKGIAVDPAGNIYVTGDSGSADFPTVNALQAAPSAGENAFVAKLNPNVSGPASLVYSTYLGGSGNDYGTAIAADAAGNAYVTGSTNSTDFPVANATQPTLNLGGPCVACSDAFVTALNTTASGSMSLLFSTYLGGSDFDYGSGIAVDATGSVYVTGTTEGAFPGSSPFPTTAGAFQGTFNGGVTDVFVTKLSSRGLSLSMNASPNPVLLHGQLTYSIIVTDIGPDSFTGVTVTDTLPAGTLFVSASPSCTGSITIICNLGTLAGNSSSALTIVVTAAAAGQISNTANVTANETNPNPSAATATAVTTVNSSSDLSVTVTASSSSVAVAGIDPDGGHLTYTIVVANNGPDAASGVMLLDNLSPFITIVTPASTTQGNCGYNPFFANLTCNLGSLASGASAIITITVTPTFQAVGQMTNMATVTGTNVIDPNPANNTSTVVTNVTNRLFAISVTKSTNNGTVANGGSLTYTIVVNNGGPDAEGSVSMLDTLTSDQTFVSATSTQGTCNFGTFGLPNTLDCELGVVNGSSAVVITLVVTVQTGASAIINEARVGALDLSGVDGNSVLDGTSTSTTTVRSAVADLFITMSASPNPVPIGGTLTYTILVNNKLAQIGPSDAAPGVTMVDQLPSGVTFVSATASQGTCDGMSLIVCQLGTINPGATVPVTITVNPNSFGLITNNAGVSGDVSDPTPANNFTYPLATCAGTPPRQVSVAFLPVKYAGQATSDMTIAQLVTKTIYLKNYYLQQSMCAAQFNSTIITNPASADGWWTIPKTEAAYFPSGNNNGGDPSPLMGIWSDAFATATAASPGFLVAQATGAFDAIVVVDTSVPGNLSGGVQRAASVMNGPVLNRLVGLLSPTISGSSSVVAATIAGAIAATIAGTVGLGAGITAAVFGPLAVPLSIFVSLMFAPSLPRLAVQASMLAPMFEQGSVVISDKDGSDTWAHELGHGVFSFWDYYFYSGPTFSVRGDIQPWDIMSGPSGDVPPAPFSSYNKQIAGWLGYIDIPSNGFGNYPLTSLRDLTLGSPVFRYQTPRNLVGFPNGPTAWYIFELRTPPDNVPIPPEQLNSDGTPPQPFNDPGDGQTGVVIYDKREVNRLFGVAVSNPYCGTAHGALEQGLVDTLIDLEFASCLWKVDNVANGTAASQGLPPGANNFTLVPGGPPFIDDIDNVTFSLDTNNVLNIHGTATSRTVVRMEVNDIGFGVPTPGGAPTAPIAGDAYPIDLHVYTADGRHVGPNYSAGGYDVGVAGARVGGINSTAQWISLPDNIPASFTIDASSAVANALARGLQSLNIDATASIFRYDANGVVGKVTDPVHFTLNLTQPATAQISIPLGSNLGLVQDLAPPVVTSPAAISIFVTEAGGARVSASQQLATFLAGATAVDDVDPFVSPMLPQVAGMDVTNNTLFPLGTTTVTFRFQDASGKIGTANSTVTVLPPDTTPPITIATLSSAANAAGWNNTAVTVTLRSTDNEFNGTGVKEVHYTIGSNTPVVVPGASTSFTFPTDGIFPLTYFGVDNAGNVETTHSLTVKIDQTPPTVAFGTATPSANAAGWNNTNVSIPFTTADNLSGVASSIPATSPLVLTSEGVAVTGSVTATDVAGNTAIYTSPASDIDKTPPTIALTTPVNGATYSANQSLNAAFACTDTLSGVATCVGTVPSGSKIDTAPNGVSTPKTFTVNATDKAGNPSSHSVGYMISCHYVALGINPSTVARGGTVTITGTARSCTQTAQTVSVKFTLTGPLGPKSCASIKTDMFTTPGFTIQAGTLKSVSFPFLIPKTACAGTFTTTATTLIGGNAVDSTSAILAVH